MSRALVTFASGGHVGLLQLSLPGFRAYAARHGYELRVGRSWNHTRPASWLKVPLLLEALDWYEEVLWLDADIVIVADDEDIAEHVPAAAWQALVAHHTADGEVPNCGVWLLRRQMQPLLERLWRMSDYIEHPWWEQAGMLDLLGYRHRGVRPVRLAGPTLLYRHTHWLSLEWNSHEQADRHPNPRFAHATCGPVEWRADVMRAYLTRAEALAPS